MNVLDPIIPKLIARGLLALREWATMVRIVNTGEYSDVAARKGAVITVPIPSARGTRDVVPGPVPPAPTQTKLGQAQIPLNNWKGADFFLTDKEELEILSDSHFLPMQTAEALRAIASDMNRSVHEQYPGVYGFTGTPGTTPFQTPATPQDAGTADATQARKILNAQLAPLVNRRAVVDFDAEANMLELRAFQDAEKVGSATVKIEGEIGRKFGIDWFADHEVVVHEAGTLGAFTIDGVHAVGVTEITLTGDATTLNDGDIITFAGDSQTYAVASTTGSVVTISPGLKIATAGGEAITIADTHVVNLVFHRDAFALAVRPLMESSRGREGGSVITSPPDPLTGIVIRLEVSRQHKQTVWDYDVLWGTGLVRPEYAVRIAG